MNTLEYGCSGARAVEAIRELQTLVGDLRAEVEQLKAKVAELEYKCFGTGEPE